MHPNSWLPARPAALDHHWFLLSSLGSVNPWRLKPRDHNDASHLVGALLGYVLALDADHPTATPAAMTLVAAHLTELEGRWRDLQVGHPGGPDANPDFDLLQGVYDKVLPIEQVYKTWLAIRNGGYNLEPLDKGLCDAVFYEAFIRDSDRTARYKRDKVALGR